LWPKNTSPQIKQMLILKSLSDSKYQIVHIICFIIGTLATLKSSIGYTARPLLKIFLRNVLTDCYLVEGI
jgi:hypothetical protein